MACTVSSMVLPACDMQSAPCKMPSTMARIKTPISFAASLLRCASARTSLATAALAGRITMGPC